jgi:hypothetical protein
MTAGKYDKVRELMITLQFANATLKTVKGKCVRDKCMIQEIRSICGDSLRKNGHLVRDFLSEAYWEDVKKLIPEE